MTHRPTILFVCIHNAGRSQMAAGWARHLAGDRVLVLSAGSAPAATINPVAVQAMSEVDIDISGQRPRRFDPDEARASAAVATMGCGEECPVVPGGRYEDWSLDDPAGQSIETVRQIRDDIRGRVENLLADLGAL